MLSPFQVSYAPPAQLTEKQNTIAKNLGVQILKISSCFDGCTLTKTGHKEHFLASYVLYDNKQYSACFDNNDQIDIILSIIDKQKEESFINLAMSNLSATGGRILLAF